MRKPVPGRLFVWVKRLSWIELSIFAALIAFWLIARVVRNVLKRVLRRVSHSEQVNQLLSYSVFLALLAVGDPVGPVGSVIGIELIERRGWGVGDSPQKIVESP